MGEFLVIRLVGVHGSGEFVCVAMYMRRVC